MTLRTATVRSSRFLSSLVLASCLSLLSSAPAVAQTAPTSPTAQQLFDQASDAALHGDCATALPLFERLMADPRIKPGSLSASAIALRRGVCLQRRGQAAEAEAAIQAGLPGLRAAGADFAFDVASGEQALGLIAMERWDRDAAVAHLKAALAVSTGRTRLPILVRLGQAMAFDGTGEPLAHLAEALRIEEAASKPDKRSLARIHIVTGRVLTNQGRAKEAHEVLKKALTLTGGLTQRIDLEQAALRGDLALAALMEGRKEQARLYLAYTGAGRIQESPFTRPATMIPPQCGPETGLAPEDSAIVEFSIGDDGDVMSASTVHTRGNHAVAGAFARAVERWWWDPAEIARIPAFYRVLTRVEIRCTNDGGRAAGFMRPVQERFATWAEPHLEGLDLDRMKLGDGLERLAAIARQREASGDLAGAVAAHAARGAQDPTAGALASFERALALAPKANPPQTVLNAIALFKIGVGSRLSRREEKALARQGRLTTRAEAATLLTTPGFANDPLARATLILTMAMLSGGNGSWLDAETALQQVTMVADDNALPAGHPLRQAALLQLANVAAASDRMADARALFDRTGLSVEQCALIAPAPAVKSTGISSADYPQAALLMGFEGWANVEFDINADGSTANPRAVTAYPPFVFVEAATSIMRSARFESSYRPAGATACSAHRRTLQFRLP